MNNMDINYDLNRWETEYKKGFAKPLILLMLSKGTNYSYALAKQIAKETHGKISIAVPNIYPIMKSLRNKGYIIEIKDKSQPKRVLYKLTDSGYELLEKISNSMNSFMSLFQELIKERNENIFQRKVDKID